MVDPREHTHKLIDRMPEAQLSGLVQLVESIVDPAMAALRSTSVDEEPETALEKAVVDDAKNWLQENGGEGISHSEAMRKLGLD